MGIAKRIGLAAVALAAIATGVFAATGFGEGDGEPSGFSYLSGEGARVAAQGDGAGWAEAAGGGGRRPTVIVVARATEIAPGQSFRRVGRCPKRSVAINGLFGPEFGGGVNMQGFAGITRRKWGFQFENETGEPVSTLLGIVCLKNAKLDIRMR